MENRSGIGTKAEASAERMMKMINEGDLHMHIMGNSSIARYGEIEHKELVQYGDFIKTKLCFDLLQLTGDGDYE